MVALFVGATAIALMEFVRTRDRRVAALLALFAFLALSRSREDWQGTRTWFDVGALASGLVLLALLSPRHSPESDRPRA